jgi:hypothetical protein
MDNEDQTAEMFQTDSSPQSPSRPSGRARKEATENLKASGIYWIVVLKPSLEDDQCLYAPGPDHASDQECHTRESIAEGQKKRLQAEEDREKTELDNQWRRCPAVVIDDWKETSPAEETRKDI